MITTSGKQFIIVMITNVIHVIGNYIFFIVTSLNIRTNPITLPCSLVRAGNNMIELVTHDHELLRGE